MRNPIVFKSFRRTLSQNLSLSKRFLFSENKKSDRCFEEHHLAAEIFAAEKHRRFFSWNFSLTNHCFGMQEFGNFVLIAKTFFVGQGESPTFVPELYLEEWRALLYSKSSIEL